MNREQTAEAIKVMQGFVDGKPVECRNRSSVEPWRAPYDSEGASWNWPTFEYRLAPPKPWYRVALFRTGGLGVATLAETESTWGSAPTFVRWLTDRIEYEPAEGGAK